jgi:flagellar biosynthesis/type III secretory pathway protein FliH
MNVAFCRVRYREEELKNALAASKSKVRDLEISLREAEAGGQELKRAMKEATDSEYAISQKLAYEAGARQGLEAEFRVVLKSLQSDQITIAGYEVELIDLKGATNYGMACIAIPAGVLIPGRWGRP